MKREIVILLASLCVFSAGADVAREDVTLAWDPSPTLGVAGYRVYDSGNLIADTTNTQATVRVTKIEPHDFYATAYTAAGEESGPSNKVAFDFPLPTLTPEPQVQWPPPSPVLTPFVEELNWQLFSYWSQAPTNDWGWVEGQQPTAWLRNVDLSGLALAGWTVSGFPLNHAGADVTLVSPSWGISALHIFGRPIGASFTFVGNTGVFHTRHVAAVITNGDLALVQFDKPFPRDVVPFQLLTPVWPHYSANLAGLDLVWYRNNTAHLSVVRTDYSAPVNGDGLLYAPLRNPNCPFTEGWGTPGDSGAPMFFIINGKPVLGAVTLFADPAGIFLAQPWATIWIAQNVFPEYLDFADLSAVVSHAVPAPEPQ